MSLCNLLYSYINNLNQLTILIEESNISASVRRKTVLRLSYCKARRRQLQLLLSSIVIRKSLNRNIWCIVSTIMNEIKLFISYIYFL